MITVRVLLLVLAFLTFVGATVGTSDRVHLTPLGLAFLTLSMLV